MSDYVRYTGKMKKVDCIPKDYEIFAVSELGMVPIPLCYDSHLEYLIETQDEKYTLIDGVLYEIFELLKPDMEYDYFKGTLNGTVIEFDTQFYNGGCSLPDALNECLNKIKGNK